MNSFGKWLDFLRRGAVDHERDIGRICAVLPPKTTEEIDYLEHVLLSDSLRPVFVEKALSLEWVDWVEERGFLDKLFMPQIVPNDQLAQLAEWYIGRLFAIDATMVFERIICREQSASKLLWDILCRRMHFTERASLGDSIFAAIVNFLIEISPHNSNFDFLNFVLRKCDSGKDLVVAERLFLWLSEPRFAGKRGLRFRSVNPIETEEALESFSTFRGQPYWLRESWSCIFAPNIVKLSNAFFVGLCRNLLEIYRIEEGRFFFDPREYDSVTHKRSAIENCSQNASLSEHLDILIEALRDILAKQAELCPEKYRVNVLWLSQNEVSLFQRIVMHSLSGNNIFTADEKASLILENDWLFNWNNHHEAFLVAESIFASNSASAKARLLEVVEYWPGVDSCNVNKKECALNSSLELISWLCKKFPAEDALSDLREKLEKKLPDFKPFSHPEFTSWSEHHFGRPTHLCEHTPDDLLLMTAEEVTRLLESRKTLEDSFEEDGIWSALKEAGLKNADWYVRLAETLSPSLAGVQRFFLDFLYWARDSKVLTEEHNRILVVVKACGDQDELSRESAEVLLQWMRSGLETSKTHVQEMLDVAFAIWTGPARLQTIEFSDESDRYTLSINHIGGRLSEVLIHGLSRLAGGAPFADGLPSQFRFTFDEMTDCLTQSAKMGLVTLASQLAFLYTVDRTWTQSKLLPKFSWTNKPEAAVFCWQGFLVNRRLNQDLLNELWDDLVLTISKREELGRYREQLCSFLSGVVFYSEIDVFELLAKFLQHADKEDFRVFYHQCKIELKTLNAEQRAVQKERWIDRYFDDRVHGKMPIFQEHELNGLIGISRFYPELLGLIGSEVSKLTSIDDFYFGLLTELLEDDGEAIRKSPAAVADLVLYRLRLQQGYCSPYRISEVMELVIEVWPDQNIGPLEAIYEEMLRLQLPEASTILPKLLALKKQTRQP